MCWNFLIINYIYLYLLSILLLYNSCTVLLLWLYNIWLLYSFKILVIIRNVLSTLFVDFAIRYYQCCEVQGKLVDNIKHISVVGVIMRVSYVSVLSCNSCYIPPLREQAGVWGQCDSDPDPGQWQVTTYTGCGVSRQSQRPWSHFSVDTSDSPLTELTPDTVWWRHGSYLDPAVFVFARMETHKRTRERFQMNSEQTMTNHTGEAIVVLTVPPAGQGYN